jgi:hypothetical protein
MEDGRSLRSLGWERRIGLAPDSRTEVMRIDEAVDAPIMR